MQVQRARQARSLAPYYSGSLPNVNQMVRAACDAQGQVSCNLEQSCAVRRHLMSDQSHRERRLSPPGRPSRRHQTDSAPYHSVHQSPPPGSYWRRNWPNSCSTDRGQEVRLPATALNRTNSDSALHTTVRNTHIGDQMCSAQVPTPRNRRSAFPYPVPLIEENLPEESKPLKKDCNKLSQVPSGSAQASSASSQHAVPTPSQQGGGLLPLPSSLNMSGSLPDLSSLHLPSSQPTGLEMDPLGQATCLGHSSSSSDHLPGGLTHPGIKTDDAYHLPGLSPMPASLSNPLLQSSLSSPNIQSSLSSNSLPNSLSAASLRLSLSNSSLKSSLSNQSLLSSLSSSSLSNQSLQSGASHCSYSSGIGGSRSCSSSSLSGSPRASNQSHPPHSGSSRKRNQLSPLMLPSGGDSRWHHPKQFSPTMSPTLTSITQGVLLNTNQMSRDSRPPTYPYNQPQHSGLSQQPLHHPPYPPMDTQLLHHPPVGEPPMHNANHYQQQQQQQQLHQGPLMPTQPVHQPPMQQHQPYHQPPAYPKRQCQHAQPPQQQQSHLLKHLQAPSPPPPQLQAAYPQSQAGPHLQPALQYPQPQQHPLQSRYHCEPSQPLHHACPLPPQLPYAQPQPFVQQQQQHHQQHQSQWPPPHLQPDHHAPPALHHHHHHQQQQHQPQHPQQQHPSWPGPNQAHPRQMEGGFHGAQFSTETRPAQESLKAGAPMRAQGHRKSRSQHLQDAVAGSSGGHSGNPQKMTQTLQTGSSSQGESALDSGLGLHNESYMGLSLTPSQTKALSQQLGHLCKEPVSGAVSDADKEGASFQSLVSDQDQKNGSGICHSFTDTMLADAVSWLDQEIAGFPAMLELDDEALELGILRDEEFTSDSATDGTFYNPAN
ncbi:hypothetical protein ACEWY4_024057 [Coilia grayii]|uniref:Transducer of regulated CREB activity middle domain-containing protein n=1 Tax=Coilia grayii TaxID=363190 RepID=A0ABD1IZB7_9TELE